MYKILRSDDASDFDEISWRYFNTTGGDNTTWLKSNSTTDSDFIEYEYTADDLDEFIVLQLKFVCCN